MSQARVAIIGGGYAGVTVARALDEVAQVSLIEPKDHFVHASASLRAVADAAWDERVFHGYDRLLQRGEIVHDTARLVSGNEVRFSPTQALAADYIVLASGTAYPFPAKFIEAHSWVARSRLDRLRAGLGQAQRVLIVGAGPVGLELAGELSHSYPGLRISIVEQGPVILPDSEYSPELRNELYEQLRAAGVEFHLGTRLGYLPDIDVGELGQFTVATADGADISGQMWFRCYGNRQQSDFLAPDLAAARLADGRIAVNSALQVLGHETVFAAGDVNNVPETKRAAGAIAQGHVVAQNIKDLIAGRAPSAAYEPAPSRVVIPLGPHGGASQIEQDGVQRVLGSSETSEIKGADLMVEPVRAMLGW